MVPLTGLEPVRDRSRQILSLRCLPIPPQRRFHRYFSILSAERQALDSHSSAARCSPAWGHLGMPPSGCSNCRHYGVCRHYSDGPQGHMPACARLNRPALGGCGHPPLRLASAFLALLWCPSACNPLRRCAPAPPKGEPRLPQSASLTAPSRGSRGVLCDLKACTTIALSAVSSARRRHWDSISFAL